jgi:hypothetical protein
MFFIPKSSALVRQISFVRSLAGLFFAVGILPRANSIPAYTQFLDYEQGFAEKRRSRASFGGRTDENNLSVHAYKAYSSHKSAKFQLADYEKRNEERRHPHVRYGPLVAKCGRNLWV